LLSVVAAVGMASCLALNGERAAMEALLLLPVRRLRHQLLTRLPWVRVVQVAPLEIMMALLVGTASLQLLQQMAGLGALLHQPLVELETAVRTHR
jgi:hypothetical protein